MAPDGRTPCVRSDACLARWLGSQVQRMAPRKHRGWCVAATRTRYSFSTTGAPAELVCLAARLQASQVSDGCDLSATAVGEAAFAVAAPMPTQPLAQFAEAMARCASACAGGCARGVILAYMRASFARFPAVGLGAEPTAERPEPTEVAEVLLAAERALFEAMGAGEGGRWRVGAPHQLKGTLLLFARHYEVMHGFGHSAFQLFGVRLALRTCRALHAPSTVPRSMARQWPDTCASGVFEAHAEMTLREELSPDTSNAATVMGKVCGSLVAHEARECASAIGRSAATHYPVAYKQLCAALQASDASRRSTVADTCCASAEARLSRTDAVAATDAAANGDCASVFAFGLAEPDGRSVTALQQSTNTTSQQDEVVVLATFSTAGTGHASAANTAATAASAAAHAATAGAAAAAAANATGATTCVWDVDAGSGNLGRSVSPTGVVAAVPDSHEELATAGLQLFILAAILASGCLMGKMCACTHASVVELVETGPFLSAGQVVGIATTAPGTEPE